MSKMLISFAALATLTVAAHAQSPAPPQATSPSAATPGSSDAAKPAGEGGQSGVGDTANQETYKMMNGGMYQPPTQRPASPAMDTKTYGRT